MHVRDRLLAIAVAVMWGANFLAIHATIEHFPPLFAAALRFAVIALPTILFVPWPGGPAAVGPSASRRTGPRRASARGGRDRRLRPFRRMAQSSRMTLWLIGYGLGFGTGQFAFLFVGMHIGMPTGLASLVLQASAPFTVLLGAFLLRERITPRAVAGICLAVAGMSLIAWQRAENAALLPVLLTLAAALSWAVGNLCSRRGLAGRADVNPLHFTLWMCVIPPVPLYGLSLAFEGPAAGWQALTTVATPQGWLALGGLVYIVLIGTVVGSGIWSTLMRRNPAAAVAPFSLLVPIVGMTLAFLLLGERPTAVELAAGVVVIAGVLLGSTARRRAVKDAFTTPNVAKASFTAPEPTAAKPAAASAYD